MALRFETKGEAAEHARALRVALAALANDLETYGMDEDAERVWHAWDQSGDVIEELEGTY